MESPVNRLEKSIRILRRKEVYIHSLRFPNYRNLATNSEIFFDFPITVLLGRNGTNKSSILHALYGSVKGNSIGHFWFETKLDAIPESRNGLNQSVVHRYRNKEGVLVECLKLRYYREGDPEYWEAAKHVKKYYFSDPGVRISPIDLEVKHLDFRGELPAFDKYFYFPDPKHLEKLGKRGKERRKSAGKTRGRYTKQDYLRSRSSQLKRELQEKGKDLTEEELRTLRYVLERSYVSGKVWKHSLLHGHEGWTILFETKNISGYSDAFAGSGESAAALLVHNVLEAPDNSLILLDEPETSLHPRAQQRMLEFLAHQAVQKSLQIVISTHSVHIAEHLPQEAVRVLQLRPNGHVYIESDISAQEAFHEVGTFPAGKTILVEDERAKAIVSAALQLEIFQVEKNFKIIVQKGGTSKIYADIKAFSNSERKDIFVLFDGDHRPQKEIPDLGNLPQGERGLKDLILSITKGNNVNGPDVYKKIGLENRYDMTEYICFFKRYVHFLPALTPEHFVWHDRFAAELLGEDLPPDILEEGDVKKKIYLLGEKVVGMDSDGVFQFLLMETLRKDQERILAIRQCIENIRAISSK